MSNAAIAADTIYVPDWSFADKFRKARLSVNMDQREFAEALKLTASTVASYETGRSMPRFRVATDLAKRLQMLTRIDYRWFLDVAPGGEAPPSTV